MASPMLARFGLNACTWRSLVLVIALNALYVRTILCRARPRTDRPNLVDLAPQRGRSRRGGDVQAA